MKKIILLCFVLGTFSCKTYYQIYDIGSTNCKLDQNKFFISESDSIKVIYSFWNEYGTLAFTFYNKLDKPIYIDWKKSSYVYNGMKKNYWEDVVYSSSQGVGVSASEYRKDDKGDFYINGKKISTDPTYLYSKYGVSATFSQSKLFKPEPVTFIPPKSFISVNKFYIGFYSPISNKAIIRENDTLLGKMIFNEGNSILTFRNFITFSTDDKFEKTSGIDDFFYLKTLKEFRYDGGDISLFAQPNKYFVKLNHSTYGTNKFVVGDKVVIHKGTHYYFADITSISTSYDVNHSLKATVEYKDETGKTQTSEILLSSIECY